LGSLICSLCCGTKRQKEIDCPEDCFYLGKSKRYFAEREETQLLSDFEREMRKVIGDEDQYLDILQNIEFGIYAVYKKQGNITDRDAETALEYLFEMGKAQLDLPSKFLTTLPPNVQSVVDVVDDILKMRETVTRQKEPLMKKLKCIYRVLDSVRTHYSLSDEYSYLNFIGQFLR